MTGRRAAESFEHVQRVFGDFLSTHQLEVVALGSARHRDFVELHPFDCTVRYVVAEDNPALVRSYLASNRRAFCGPLALPGWVLTDLYILPGVVGLLLGSPDEFRTELPLDRLDDGRAILAAYYGAPSLTPGLFIGVSLFSLVPGLRAGTMIKALTLGMYRATRLRGVSRWSAAAIRAHARVGRLRLLSKAPGPHENEADSFVYETDVDVTALAEGLSGTALHAVTERIDLDDRESLDAVVARARAGEGLFIVTPGVDGHGRVCLGRS